MFHVDENEIKALCNTVRDSARLRTLSEEKNRQAIIAIKKLNEMNQSAALNIIDPGTSHHLLMLAIGSGKFEIAKEMLNANVETNVSYLVDTPLSYAAAVNKKGSCDLLKTLVDIEAKAVSKDRRSIARAIQWTLRRHDIEKLQIILTLKTGINDKNPMGKTALDTAIQYKVSNEMINILRKHGALTSAECARASVPLVSRVSIFNVPASTVIKGAAIVAAGVAMLAATQCRQG